MKDFKQKTVNRIMNQIKNDIRPGRVKQVRLDISKWMDDYGIIISNPIDTKDTKLKGRTIIYRQIRKK